MRAMAKLIGRLTIFLLVIGGQLTPTREIEMRGTATFDVATNVPTIHVYGKSTALLGRAQLRQDGDQLIVEEVAAIVPVKTLATGIGLRDDHMRREVFTLPDGKVPDLKFYAERVICVGGAIKICPVFTGTLTIREIVRPLDITLMVKTNGAGYRVTGDGQTTLSRYDIPAPSQLGVMTADDVKLHIDLDVR
jgi:polyisoprenoid-binding protein YceI